MKDSRVDVSFHHSDPFNGSIHCRPSRFDRGYFLQSSQLQASFQSCCFFLKRQIWKGTQKWSFELLFMLLHDLVNSWRSTLLPLTTHIHVTCEICGAKWKSSRWMCRLMSERKGRLISLETPRRFERKVVKTDVASCKSKRLAPNKSLFKVRTVRALCPSFILLPIDQIHFMAES